MDVVIVEAVSPSSEAIGGSETYTRNLINDLTKKGIRTTLIGISSPNTAPSRREVDFVPVSANPKLGNHTFVWKLIASRAFTHVQPESVVHVQRPEYALPFVLFCRKNPVVVTLHGKILESTKLKHPKWVASLFSIVESYCLQRSTAVIVVDEGTRNYYASEYPWLASKMKVIPTGIDLDKFRLMEKGDLRRKWGFNTRDQIVIFVGRLEAEKDVDFLIDSFRIVSEQMPHARLVLVGDGKEKKRLEHISRDLQPERISFLGAQSPDLMPEILNCADVLSLCSLFEGSPNTVKEALACGVPVVTTPVGDVNEYIRGGVGIVVPKNKVQFARALMDILSVSDRDHQRMACVTASRMFGFDQIGTRTVAIYDEALAELKVVKEMSCGRNLGVKA